MKPEQIKDAVEGMMSVVDGNYEQETHYSGRGMFGQISPYAFSCRVHPFSPDGQRLQAMGLTYDNLGYDWIYYLK